MDTELHQMVELSHDGIKKNKTGEQVIQQLNSLINHTDKWKQRLGICVLLAVLKKCDTEVFEENATAWMRFILKVINTIPSEDLLRICFGALTKVLEYASSIDKVSRDIATRGMDTLLTLLITSPAVPLSSHKLNMLKCCIRRFPAPCGPHRTNLIKLTIRAIESDDCLVSSTGCELFTLIAMCGTAGEKKNRLADNWVNQFYQVTNTIFYYLSKLQKASDDSSSTALDTAKLVPFSEINEKLDISSTKMALRIERLLFMLQNIVSTKMEFEVQFPLLRLVKVFCELCNVLHVDMKENEEFSLTRTKISTALLKCMSAAIRQLKTTLLVFSQQLGKMLSSVVLLRDTTNRHLLYQCFLDMLNHWTVLPSNIFELVLATIFSDIRVYEKSTEVPDDVDHSHKKDNLATNLKNDINEHGRKEIKRDQFTANQNAFAALVLIEKVLLFSGSLLSTDNLDSILSNVSNACVGIYRKVGYTAPYSIVETRLRLLKVAKRLLHLNHGEVRVPVAIVLSHFTDALTDVDIRVRDYCREVLIEYDSVMHSLDLGFYGNKTESLQHEFGGNLMGETTTLPKVPLEKGMVRSSSNAELGIQGVSGSGVNPRSCGSADNVLSKETTNIETVPRRSSAEAALQAANQSSLSDRNFSTTKVISIPHPNKNLPQPFPAARPCGSADQVLSRNAEPIPVPRRSTSEPQVHYSEANKPTNIVIGKSPNKFVSKSPSSNQNTIINKPSSNMNIVGNAPMSNQQSSAAVNITPSSKLPPMQLNVASAKPSNAAIHIDDESPSPDKDCVALDDGFNGDQISYAENDENYNENYENEECYGNDAVVISDSSDEDVSCTKSVRKLTTIAPVNQTGVGNGQNMYSPRAAKRAKLNNNGGANIQYNEDDADYILSTFCENSTADQ